MDPNTPAARALEVMATYRDRLRDIPSKQAALESVLAELLAAHDAVRAKLLDQLQKQQALYAALGERVRAQAEVLEGRAIRGKTLGDLASEILTMTDRADGLAQVLTELIDGERDYVRKLFDGSKPFDQQCVMTMQMAWRERDKDGGW